MNISHFLDNWIKQNKKVFNDRYIILFNIIILIIIMLALGYEIESTTKTQTRLIKNTKKPITPTITTKGNIETWHLFGEEIATAPKNKWIVKGIFINPTNKKSQAVLASENNQEETYEVGNQLPDGEVIITILPDRVVLARNGITEELLLIWENENTTVPAENIDGD